MSESYVFDAEPLITHFYDEPGAERVESLLTDVYDGDVTGLLSEVTATEITYKIAWLKRATGRPTPTSTLDGRRCEMSLTVVSDSNPPLNRGK